MSKLDNTNKIQEAIEKGPQPLYKLFNTDAVRNILAVTELENTRWQGVVSKKSLRIRCKETQSGKDLERILDLNADAFEEKYQEAISGDGMEGNRIRTLHSSSLISLLCFHGISDSKPLLLELNGNKTEFTSVHFEVKNPVGTDEFGREHESNIDVALTGHDELSGRPVILFLESKFSEYLHWGSYNDISQHVYGDIYTLLDKNQTLDRMGLKYQDGCLSATKGFTHHYAGGIKQMVSHYLGVNNIIEKYKGHDIYLGEIIYKFPESIDDAHRKFEDYTGLYKILAEGLNELSDDRFKIVNKCMTYQEVFKAFELNERVRTLYSL